MTVLMTFFGTIVFVFSTFTVGFKAAWKRLMGFAVTGLIIDCFVIGVSSLVMLSINYL